MGEWVRGKRYLLVIVASYSGYPTSREDAKAVIKALISHYVPQHGFPKITRSDNSSYFKNKHLETAETQMGLRHKLGSVYHPQSERKVKRMNLNLKTKLVKTVATPGLNWLDALSLVLPSINRFIFSEWKSWTSWAPLCAVGPPIPGNTKVMCKIRNHLSTSLSLQAPRAARRAARHDYGDSSTHKSVQTKVAGASVDGTVRSDS